MIYEVIAYLGIYWKKIYNKTWLQICVKFWQFSAFFVSKAYAFLLLELQILYVSNSWINEFSYFFIWQSEKESRKC
jgi:hypothetical protein